MANFNADIFFALNHGSLHIVVGYMHTTASKDLCAIWFRIHGWYNVLGAQKTEQFSKRTPSSKSLRNHGLVATSHSSNFQHFLEQKETK